MNLMMLSIRQINCKSFVQGWIAHLVSLLPYANKTREKLCFLKFILKFFPLAYKKDHPALTQVMSLYNFKVNRESTDWFREGIDSITGV